MSKNKKNKSKIKKSQLEKYCDFVEQMASEHSTYNFDCKLGTVGLGLTGEAGEVADLIKKCLYQGKEFDKSVGEELTKEIGDVLWYVAFACRFVLGKSMEEVLQLNVSKLQERYKQGKFTVDDFNKKENKKKKKAIIKAKIR